MGKWGRTLVLSDSDAGLGVVAVDLVEVAVALGVEHLGPGGSSVGGLGDSTRVAGHGADLVGLDLSTLGLEVNTSRQLVHALLDLGAIVRPGAGRHIPGLLGREGTVTGSVVGGVESDVEDVPVRTGVGGHGDTVDLLLGGGLHEGTSGAQERRAVSLDVLGHTSEGGHLHEVLGVLGEEDATHGSHSTSLAVGGESHVHVHASSRANVLTGLKGVGTVHQTRAKGVVGHGTENLGRRHGRNTAQGGDLNVRSSPGGSKSNANGGKDSNKAQKRGHFGYWFVKNCLPTAKGRQRAFLQPQKKNGSCKACVKLFFLHASSE